MITSTFNAKLLPTAPSATVVVIRVVAVASSAPQGLEQHTIPEPHRRKPGGVSRLSSFRKVGPEEKDQSIAGSGTTPTRKCFTDAELIVHFLEQ